MHLIGGKDYYDTAAPFNTDRSRPFVRTRLDKYPDDALMEFPQFAFHSGIEWKDSYGYRDGYVIRVNGKSYTHKINTINIIFCGVMYNGVMVEYYQSGGMTEGPVPIPVHHFKFFWNKEEFQEYLTENKFELRTEKYSKWLLKDIDEESLPLDSNTMTRYFMPQILTGNIAEFLIEKEICTAIPVMESRKYKNNLKWKVNTDGLHTLGLQKRLPAWQAYQELDMFLGSILVRDEDRQVVVSDASKLAKHGFDGYSFKNKVHPSKPRATNHA